MIAARLRTLEEFIAFKSANAHTYARIRTIEDGWHTGQTYPFRVHGYSYTAQQAVAFLVDYQYGDGIHINWRERVVCPITQLNNRLRASLQFADFELAPSAGSAIYLSEQVTPFYAWFRKKYPWVIGSEFLGPGYKPGSVNDAGLRHEDATNLSFADGSLDYYLTFDCLEHIPGYQQAFREANRVLKPGGILYWSVPFVCDQYDNIVRATQAPDGSIHHQLPPDYHGDPLDPAGGILCYTWFGWQMLDQLRAAGFSNVYALTYWSDTLGYYGADQFLFFAMK